MAETITVLESASPPEVLESPGSIDVVEVAGEGPQGPKGDKGDKGDPGPQGEPGTPGDAPQSYTHQQGTPSDAWTVPHGLGYRPAGVHVEDSAGTDHEPADIEHVDSNTTILHFAFPFGGTAYLS